MTTISPEPFDSSDAIWAVTRYFRELIDHWPGATPPAEDMLAGRDVLAPPLGTFLIARSGDEVVGCGGLKRFDASSGEVKQIWVEPATRGQGLGRRLLESVEREATRIGYERVVLDTSAHLIDAIALYRRSGYVEIARYNDNPYAQLWFEKSLAQ